MANEGSTDGTSSSQVTCESSEATMEINIKTLDSQIYTFRVNKDMSVPMLKEKLVIATGVPVEQQRLIFRGKVLKDNHLLSEYHLEDGDTLHLVARQPAQSEPTPGTGPVGTSQNNSNQGNDSTAGAPRSSVGQVSHSVVLGTVNIADQGESMLGDMTRLIGSLVNSLGIGTMAPAGGASNMSPATAVPSSAETQGTQNASGRPQSGNQAPPGFMFLNHPFPPFQHISHGTLSRQMVIPDSLATLFEFVSRLEIALQSGSHASPLNNVQDPARSETPSLDTRGLPTPAMLRSVMERVQQLLRGNAAAALAHVAERLDREGTSSDPVVRGQIQAEAMHLGVAMHHLGTMLLELGRTIMTLRMGQSSAESSVNAGPAIYISPTGSNPIMVQPFPHPTSSLFGVSSPSLVSGVSGSIATGDPSRNINIHIHAGTSAAPGVSSAGAMAASGEAARGERLNGEQASMNGNGSGDSGAARGLPSRTVLAAFPANPTAETAGHVLSLIYPVPMRSQQLVPVRSTSSVQGPRPPAVSSGTQPQTPILGASPSSDFNNLPTLGAQVNAVIASALSGSAQAQNSLSPSIESAETQSSRPTVSCEAQLSMVSSLPQAPLETETIATSVTQTNAPIAIAVSGNPDSQSSNPTFTDTRGSQVPVLPSMDGHDANDHAGNVADAEDGMSGSVKSHVPDLRMLGTEGQQLQQEGLQCSNNVDSRGSMCMEESSTSSTKGGDTVGDTEPVKNSSGICLGSMGSVHASQLSQGGESSRSSPLGLGLGGLQPKRRGKLAKPTQKDEVSRGTLPTNQHQQSIARGQQFLHTLASQSSNANRVNANDTSIQLPSVIGPSMDSRPLEGQSGSGQLDAANMMSQVLQSPAFNSLLTGVAAQTGVGSSSDLRSMLEQCTQNPSVRSTLNEIVHQVEGQNPDLGDMISGLGRGRGRIDFSRLVQQMMPVVSQAIGRGSTNLSPIHSVPHGHQPQTDGRTYGEDMFHDRNSQIDLQQAVQRIEQDEAPGNVFRAVLESVSRLYGEENSYGDLVEELAGNSELIGEFMEMFCRDIRRRQASNSMSNDMS